MIQNPPTRDLLGKVRARTEKKKLSMCSKPGALKPGKLPEADVEKARGVSKRGDQGKTKVDTPDVPREAGRRTRQ